MTDFEEVRLLCKEIKITKSSGLPFISAGILKDALLVLGKLLEKIVHKRISVFFEANKILLDQQGGFRCGRSTVDSVTNFTNDVLRSINDSKVTAAAFVDLRKAFDTVDHSILIRKIENLGIREGTLGWLRNYLSNRSQTTYVNGNTSDAMGVNYSVPQGSILGPLLFLAYINDVQYNAENVEILLYADDTVLYAQDENPDFALAKLQEGVGDFVDWCNKNKLSLNVEKTKAMFFGSRPRVKRATNLMQKLRANGTEIQQVPTFKYLGFTLDQTLNFQAHIRLVTQTVAYKCFLLSKIRKFLTIKAALDVYNVMILPYLDYCDVVYAQGDKASLEKLQRLQNRCLRICLKEGPTSSRTALHKNAKMAMLEDPRVTHTLNFMCKRRNDPSLVDNREVQRRAHDGLLFKVNKYNLVAYKRSVEIWER